jgi:hypothetical protein
MKLNILHSYCLNCQSFTHTLGHEEQVQESTVVHESQVVRRLTFFSEQEASPGATHQLSLTFALITTLCYVCLCIKFVGVD